MLLDEPYRFAEAIANRRDYIEDQLRGGSPVVGAACSEGLLLLTMGKGSQKLFEAYDRIAMGSVGHPADIEKLRQSAIDLAHVIGFNYSDVDVTLQQIVHFGLGPAVKGAFDDVIRSPYIVRVLLAELANDGEHSAFYTVDYDGGFNRFEAAAAIGGVPEADRLMRERIEASEPLSKSLTETMVVALEAWGLGHWCGQMDSVPPEWEDLKGAAEDVDPRTVAREAMADLDVQAIVLDPSRSGKSKFRHLTEEELQPVLSASGT